jgi:hypothetical protein
VNRYPAGIFNVAMLPSLAVVGPGCQLILTFGCDCCDGGGSCANAATDNANARRAKKEYLSAFRAMIHLNFSGGELLSCFQQRCGNKFLGLQKLP